MKTATHSLYRKKTDRLMLCAYMLIVFVKQNVQQLEKCLIFLASLGMGYFLIFPNKKIILLSYKTQCNYFDGHTKMYFEYLWILNI